MPKITSTTISHQEIFILVVILFVAGGIIAGIANRYHRIERDNIRLSDAQSVMNALEMHNTLYGGLPETGFRACDGWEVGIKGQGENLFIKKLSDTNILTVPVEKFGASKCSYRYQKFTNNGCGEHVSYALFGMKLEGSKSEYHVKDVIEPCYPDIYRWTSDAHWIAFMIRE